MGHLRYGVTNKQYGATESELFSWWMVSLAFIIVILSLVAVFPARSLVHTLLNQDYISEVDLYYSLLINKNHNGVSYADIQNNPLMVINKLDANTTQTTNNNAQRLQSLWFDYIILRVISYNPKFKKDIIQKANEGMLRYFEVFKQQTTSDEQLQQLAHDALAIDNAAYALYFYEQLIARNPNRSVVFYSEVAKVALWAKQCVKSADYYFISQHKTTVLKDKRYFYFQALKTLFQCNQSTLAMELADKNIDGLSDDIETWQTLIDFAIKADKPAIAQQYLFRFLQLKNKAVSAPVAP